jgi:phage shock protein A
MEIALIAGAAVIGLLWWSGNLGKVAFLLKGFTSLFVQRQIQTLAGLEAAYTQAIEDMQKQRNQIAETFQNISGMRQMTEKEVVELREQIKLTSETVDRFLLAGKEDMALECSETLTRLQGDLKAKEPLLSPMEIHESNLEKMLKSVESSLRALEAEKHQELNKMKANMTIKDVNNRMSQLGTSINVRVLEVAKQGARAAEADALGSSTLRAISSDTRMKQVVDSTYKLNAESYLDKRRRELLHSAELLPSNAEKKLIENKP